MRGVHWLTLQRLHDDALDFAVVDLARDARSRLVEQPAEAAPDKTLAPTVCGVTCSRAATAWLLRPAAQPSTIRARSTKACVVAYSLPGSRQSRPTARSSPPGDPSASPCPRRYGSPTNLFTNFWLRTLGHRFTIRLRDLGVACLSRSGRRETGRGRAAIPCLLNHYAPPAGPVGNLLVRRIREALRQRFGAHRPRGSFSSSGGRQPIIRTVGIPSQALSSERRRPWRLSRGLDRCPGRHHRLWSSI
jgi:hypothetical protein